MTEGCMNGKTNRCEVWNSHLDVSFSQNHYWLHYFSNKILNTLHHVICRHLSARYWAYFKMATNFKLQQTMYSKLGYWNKATSKCTTTSNFCTIKNPLFGHIWSIFHQSLLQKKWSKCLIYLTKPIQAKVPLWFGPSFDTFGKKKLDVLLNQKIRLLWTDCRTTNRGLGPLAII